MKELKEKLEEARHRMDTIGVTVWNVDLTYEDVKHLLSSMEDGWVKVSERLPERGETMLFATDFGYVTQGFLAYDQNGVWVESFTSTEYANVTHWRKLPNAPTP